MVGQSGPNREESEVGFDEKRTKLLAQLRARFLASTLDDVLFVTKNAAIDRLVNDVWRRDDFPRS